MFGQQWKKDTILYVYLGSYTCKQKITSQEDQSSILVIYCIIHDSGDASVTNNQEAMVTPPPGLCFSTEQQQGSSGEVHVLWAGGNSCSGVSVRGRHAY